MFKYTNLQYVGDKIYSNKFVLATKFYSKQNCVVANSNNDYYTKSDIVKL